MFRGKPRNSRLRYNSQLENEEMNIEDWLPCSRPWLSINVLFVAHDEFMMHSNTLWWFVMRELIVPNSKHG